MRSLWVYEGGFGSLLAQFWAIYTSDGRCDAYRCGLVVGLKSENMHATGARSEIQRGPATPRERTSQRAGAVGEGRGRVNPPPRRLV